MIRKTITTMSLVVFFLSGAVFAEDWKIQPGKGVGWIKLGTQCDKIVKSFGTTVLQSERNDEKHMRYAQYGLEFYFKNDIVDMIRIGTSSKPDYSKNMYKTRAGVGIGSPLSDVMKEFGKPTYHKQRKYSTVDSYVYRSGIMFSFYRTRTDVYTITIFDPSRFDDMCKE